MTGYLNKKPISQIDALLIDGKVYTEAEIKQMIKDRK